MEFNKDLLGKILVGDTSGKVNVLKWNIESNIVKSGNNHTSELSRLIVEYQKKGKIFKKSFILKIPSAHPVYKIALRYNLYQREYPMYTEVLQEMYKIDGEHIGPRLYYVGKNNSLMLKDLSMSGYTMVDRVKQLDYEQCAIVFKKLAKFHALSVKLNQTCTLDAKFSRLYWLDHSVNFEETQRCFKNVGQCYEKIFHPESKRLVELLTHFKTGDFFQMMFEELNSQRFAFNVLNHGDLWTGNILFKFDKYGVVRKAKFIDFQRTFWMTPANDIWFFTVSSMQFDVFEDHFDLLLKTYVDTLNKTLRYLKCESYDLSDLRCDLDNLPLTAIFYVIGTLPQLISTHEEPFDFRCCIGEDGNIDFEYYNKIYENELYKKVMNKWISYFRTKGFLD